jgi:hypothetical protein
MTELRMILSMMIPSLLWASKKPKDKQKYQMLEGFSPESEMMPQAWVSQLALWNSAILTAISTALW